MIRATALVLTLLTGVSGLVYQVVWQKVLASLLGSHSEATAAVLALFLGGLSLGYALFGVVSRRVVARGGSLLLVYGVVECAIGALALLFPPLFAGVRALSLLLPQGSPALSFALDVALSGRRRSRPAIRSAEPRRTREPEDPPRADRCLPTNYRPTAFRNALTTPER